MREGQRCGAEIDKTGKLLLWFSIIISHGAIREGFAAADLHTFVVSNAKDKIQVTAAALENLNPEYVAEGAYFRAFRKSRNAPIGVYAFFPFIKDLPLDLKSYYVGYRKLSNKWVESFIKGSVPICECLESKVPFYRYFFENSNFPKKCPVTKGNYTLALDSFDKAPAPPGMTREEWKFRIKWQAKEKTILIASLQLKLEENGSKKGGRH